MNKVTKIIVNYPIWEQPNYIVPDRYESYRYAIGRLWRNPLVSICMNPSAARDNISDRTINRVISASQKLGYDGWVVFNTYPERATNAINMDKFNKEISQSNLNILKTFLLQHNIKEIWWARGDLKFDSLLEWRNEIIKTLKDLDIKIFHFWNTTQSWNPRHPLYLKIDSNNKNYLII